MNGTIALTVGHGWGDKMAERKMIYLDDAIDAVAEGLKRTFVEYRDVAEKMLNKVPSAQPEQRYTEEELRVFQHGISLSLLSKRSAQHWRYDADTAVEIEFLERLYEKVGADMRGTE